ncbi:Uncharacterised protein [Mycobacteroides abscessus subsp. abscessus]|nr:Uncharacterised protein [Mycobacteroides abscessus subsp. abscessus]
MAADPYKNKRQIILLEISLPQLLMKELKFSQQAFFSLLHF